MSDKPSRLEMLRRPHPDVHNREPTGGEAGEEEPDEESCSAFGFLRGVRDRALALELRFADGNSEGFAYSCLVSWRFNPSVGLMLKFTGDVVTLVLIRGSNLDKLVNDSVDLPHGIQRHRIMWVREMDKAEAHQVGRTGPTIDKIEVAEFDSREALQTWLNKAAPVFARH
jgi:hypothetical protein